MATDIKTKRGNMQKSPAPGNLNFYDEMEQVFDNFMRWGWMRPWRWETPSFAETSKALEARAPHVDVINRDGEIVVKAELPGVEKKNVHVSLTDNSVTIQANTSHEEKEEKGDYYRCEILRGNFSRTVPLPAVVDTSKAKANFKHSVLEMVIPKVEVSKRRNITID